MILAAMILALAAQGSPAKASPDDAVHQELRALRDTLVNAIVSQDIEAMVKHVTKDVSVTWQNLEHCRGEKQLRDFF